jgi:GT2 family glycosyltransferase
LLPDLSVVIPCHQRSDLLRACLASVIHHAPPHTEIIVVDDASPHAAASALAGEFAGVRSLRLPKQSGFCAAANAGIQAARGAVVELLNDDTEVTPGWADSALAWFRQATVGAVAPLVLCWPGGEPGHARIDSAGDRYDRGGVAGKRGRGVFLCEEYLKPRRVFGASASSAFYRREALRRVGGFPEVFGAYFEDVDLSFRLHRAGFEVVYEPASRVLHHGSASHALTDPPLAAQQSRNEELVFWRNMPSRAFWAALPWHGAVLVGKAVRRWREGNLGPFLRGRLSAWSRLREIMHYRHCLQALGPDAAPCRWLVD